MSEPDFIPLDVAAASLGIPSLEVLPMFTWTTAKPTEPGQYWFMCRAGGWRPGICEVQFYDGEGPYFYYNGDSMDVYDDMRFAGPIPQPTDQPGEAGEANE